MIKNQNKNNHHKEIIKDNNSNNKDSLFHIFII